MATRSLTSDRPLDMMLTVARLRHGPFDPTFRSIDGEVWRTGLFADGPATYRLTQVSPRSVTAAAWGPGADAMLASLDDLLGERDDTTGFTPPPSLRTAHRRAVGLRVPRTGLVLETLLPTILEQRVQTDTAHRAWASLLRQHGTPAPGPAPDGMRVIPDPAGWAAVPSWDWHRAGVDPGRARTVMAAVRLSRRVQEAATMDPAAATARLCAVPGVGIWTAAEVACRALGDADAVPVGDFHLPAAVGWALAGRRVDDAGMLELLAPYAPHRYRVIRLMEISGRGRPPRRGPRTPLVDHRNR